MECFTYTQNVLHMPIWGTAHRQHFVRGEGGCQKVVGGTFCLPHLIWEIRLLLYQREPDSESNSYQSQSGVKSGNICSVVKSL